VKPNALDMFPVYAKRLREEIHDLCDRIERHEGSCVDCGEQSGEGNRAGRPFRCRQGVALFDELGAAVALYNQGIDELRNIDIDRMNLHTAGDS
jgi:hypothetical protein